MTILLILILLVTIVVSLLLTASFLLLGTRLASIPDVTFRRAFLLTVITGILGLAIDILIRKSGLEESEPILAIVLGLSALPLTWMVLQRGLKTSFGRAILAWLPTLAAAATLAG